MKARFLALAALLFGMAACQTEPAFDVNMGDGTTTISVVLPEDAITREAADETNSAWGGLQNEEGEELTVTLYIFDENGNPSKEPHTATLAQGEYVANFQVRLVPDRDYTFVAWAGQKSAENLFTLGTPAHEDWTITLSEWAAMNEQRDAFTGIYSTAEKGEKFTSASNINLTLTRPFAKVRVVTTDMEWLKNINVTPAYAEVSYEVELPKTFNAYTQTIGTEVFTQKAHQTFKIKDYTKDAAGSMTLFTDYILVPESGNVKFTLTVFEANADGTAKGKEIESTSFVTDIFVKRNHLTTIVGDILTDGNNIKVTVEEDFANAQNPNDKPYYIEYKEAGSAQALVDIIDEINNSTTNEQTHISLTGDIDIDKLLIAGTYSTRASDSKNIKIASGKVIELDLKGFTISGTDKNTAGNFYLIDNRGTLTISDSSEAKTGAIKLTAETERNWNASSVVVANNPGGLLVVDGGLIEHLGGTSMAYGVDNLTNGKGTYAETVINGGTIKSTYRAVRQFLNGVEAQNILTVNGGVIEGANKSIWMQDPSKNANTGKLVVNEGATLNGDVYLFVTAGSTEWPVEVSIAASAVNGEVLTGNVPAGYAVVEKNGNWVVEYGVEENGNEVTILNVGGLKLLAAKVNAGDTFEGKTVKLGANIDLNNENWTPIGYWETFNGTFDGQNYTVKNLKHHGTEEDCYVGLFGYTDNATIKNLIIENVDLKLVANADWAGGHMGALVGNIEGTTVIENITVKGDVKIDGDMEKKGAGRIGAVVGGNTCNATFKNVVVNANANSFVKGNSSIGGIAGQLQGQISFENCSSNIDVTAQWSFAGGIIGLAAEHTTFTNCSTSGNIAVVAGREGNDNDLYRVGGIVGSWDDNVRTPMTLVNCESTCVLSGASADGRTATAFDCAGFVGRGYSAVVGAKVVVNGAEYEYAGEGIYKMGDAYVVKTGDALVAALAQKYDVTFGGDLKIDPANMSNAYGKTGVLVYNGQTIDGAGYKLDVKGAGGTWDSGICTSGGLIKNIWVTGSFRGVFVKGADHTEKIVLDNVRIEGTTYTISIDQASYQGLEAKNSIFRGWTSYAATIGEVKFDTCTFGAGNGYNFSRPYAPTQYVNCTFEAGHQMDPRAAVTFENCTIGGVALTAENLATLVTSNIANASVK
ncbi:MAG: FimB/Mfa2 family fimbrial subunit [Alistipes sp.]|nr:FimB/Mfa2 family fimbrial subunit [Alistipes sp.]